MTGLAKAPQTITVAGLGVPFSKADLDAEHAADLATLKEFAAYPAITDDQSLALLDADLSEVARLRDDLIKRRQGPVAEIKRLVSEFESWFRPYVKDIDAAIDHMKAVKGAYLTAKANKAAELREAARAAADAGDSKAVLTAITTAQALESAPAGTRYAWEAQVVNPSMVPPEYLIIDQAKLDAAAKSMGASEEQTVFVPGVSFKRVAVVQARRK